MLHARAHAPISVRLHTVDKKEIGVKITTDMPMPLKRKPQDKPQLAARNRW